MPSQLNFSPMRALDDSAIPIPGALATFFETGTTTPVTVYTDGDLTTAHPTPLVSDAQGVFAPVFTDGAVALKVNVTTADLVAVNGFPVDPVQLISSTGSAASVVSFAPITGNDATDVQGAIQNVTTWQNTANDLGATSPFASAAQGIKADAAVSNDDILNDATLSSTAVNKAPNTPSVKTYVDTSIAALPLKAWATFSGVTTVTINRQSGISTITRVSAGLYEVTLATAQPSTSYGVNATAGDSSTTRLAAQYYIVSDTVFRIYVINHGNGLFADAEFVTAEVLY